MTASENQERVIAFAIDLAGRTAVRLEFHPLLKRLETEDIEQELITYVLERASLYDPAKGNVEAFTTRLMQTAVASLLRSSSRQRSNLPAGSRLDSLSQFVEGPDRKPEELNEGLASSDGTRRRQTELRDPIRDIELVDAVERQIQTLPSSCRRVARLLRTCTQTEIAEKLGWSKRKVSQALADIRSHFSTVDWTEAGVPRDKLASNCIASSGEEQSFSDTPPQSMEKSA